NYPMPDMPADDGVLEGILRGMYRFKSVEANQPKDGLRVQLLGSGSILREVLRAQTILAERYGVSSDVWSVTSWKSLRVDAEMAERWNVLHPGEDPKSCHLWDSLKGVEGPFVAATDYVRAVPGMIERWIPGTYAICGTDGFGRSATRATLRRFFENDAESIVIATLDALARDGRFPRERLRDVFGELGFDPNKPDPITQ